MMAICTGKRRMTEWRQCQSPLLDCVIPMALWEEDFVSTWEQWYETPGWPPLLVLPRVMLVLFAQSNGSGNGNAPRGHCLIDIDANNGKATTKAILEHVGLSEEKVYFTELPSDVNTDLAQNIVHDFMSQEEGKLRDPMLLKFWLQGLRGPVQLNLP
mmetsp:Transcript_29806/g.104840  ORF Transcript_29806/g.104840 Transcript_29806/m.104840 type:complete len:157 (+) Transcript_29806:1071-1541(+)